MKKIVFEVYKDFTQFIRQNFELELGDVKRKFIENRIYEDFQMEIRISKKISDLQGIVRKKVFWDYFIICEDNCGTMSHKVLFSKTGKRYNDIGRFLKYGECYKEIIMRKWERSRLKANSPKNTSKRLLNKI